jgi:hypothetical protein
VRAPTVLAWNDVVDMKGHKRHLLLPDMTVFTAMVGALPDQCAEGFIGHGEPGWHALWLVKQR